MMRIWLVCLLVACGSSSPPPPTPTPNPAPSPPAGPLPAGCVRQRAASHHACTGVDRGDGNMESVTVCDGCVTSADCTASPGGKCETTGGVMCDSPAAFVCRYPGDVCEGCPFCSNNLHGAPVCRKGPPLAPPAMDSGDKPAHVPAPSPPSPSTPAPAPSPVAASPEPASDSPPRAPKPTKNNPRKAPKTNAASCKADLEHCCTAKGAILWLNGCCGGAVPAYCGRISGHSGDREGDGTCGGCTRKCLPATALIATPRGAREIASLAIGELVWTTNASGARVAAPIEALRSLPIEGLHELLVVTLDDGRRIRASAGHPTAASIRLDALQLGDRLDGARVTDIAREPYLGAATWDLRPAGSTTYWADGVLLGTTLPP